MLNKNGVLVNLDFLQKEWVFFILIFFTTEWSYGFPCIQARKNACQKASLLHYTNIIILRCYGFPCSEAVKEEPPEKLPRLMLKISPPSLVPDPPLQSAAGTSPSNVSPTEITKGKIKIIPPRRRECECNINFTKITTRNLVEIINKIYQMLVVQYLSWLIFLLLF